MIRFPISTFCVLAVLLHERGFSLTADGGEGEPHKVLERSSGARNHLERALSKRERQNSDSLISRACQFSLANVNSRMSNEIINCVRKDCVDLRDLGEELDVEQWREWIFPLRVLDEDPEEDGQLFRERMVDRVTVGGFQAESVLKWVWSDHGDASRIDVQSHTAENRNRSVNQLLASRQSACRELNIFYVAVLRAVGIPARHCGVARWLHRDSYHFFTEYWDADQEKWVTVDTSDDKFLTAETPAERAANGRWNSLVYYAYPGNPDEPDLYGKGRWDKMVNITGDLAEEFPMEIVWPDLERGGTLSAQIWNGGSWRTILIQEVKAGEAPVVVNFGKTHVTTRPVMFSADIEGGRYLAMVKAAELDHKVVLEKVEGGRALGWSPGEVPKEVGE